MVADVEQPVDAPPRWVRVVDRVALWKVVQPLKDIRAGLISHHAQADAHSARLFKKYGAGPSLL